MKHCLVLVLACLLGCSTTKTQKQPYASGGVERPPPRMPMGPDNGPVSATAESTYRGRLAPGDDSYTTGEWVDYYELKAKAGTEITVTLRSDDFDAFLSIHTPDGDSWGDDDGAGGRHARATIECTVDGIYRIGVTSYAAGETGAYQLEIGPWRGLREHTTERRLPGVLRAGDPTLDSGELFERHFLRVERGDELVFFTRGGTDTYLMVDLPGMERQWDDDSGDGSNARLELVAEESGECVVIVTTSSPGQSGPYTLVVGGATGPEPDEVYAGSLASGDGQLTSGEYRDTYSIEVTAGEELEISLRSGEFDSYLIVEPPEGEQLENDDLNEGWRHSRVHLTAAHTGTYEILVTSHSPGEEGHYTLSIMRSGSGPAVPELQTVRGELRGGANGDARLQAGEYCDFYSFEGVAGQTIELTMDSDRLDPYLVLVPPTGSTIENDDEREGSTRSVIRTTLQASGTVRIWATSYRIETGSYVLTLRGANARLKPDASEAVFTSRTYYAVICGISDYQGVETDLANCRADAQRLADRLIQDGVLEQDNLILLLDGEGSAENLRQAFRSMARRVGPEDIFLFFYSGHGAQGDAVASDEADERDEFLVTPNGWLSDNELAALYDGIDAKIAIAVLDACFSGGFSKDLITKPKRFGLFSSEEDLTSNVAEEFNAGGYLAHFFRRGLRGEADTNGDRSITVGELCEFLHRSYRELEIETETSEGSIGYQHLVVDRGGVKIFEELLRLP